MGFMNTIHYRKIHSILTYLKSETEKKILQISNREYGSDIIEDLNLNDYSKYFYETIDYLKSEIITLKLNSEIGNLILEIIEFDLKNILREKAISFFGFQFDFFTVGLYTSPKFANNIFINFKLINSKIENILYLISIQE
jgi:hypothetical protein